MAPLVGPPVRKIGHFYFAATSLKFLLDTRTDLHDHQGVKASGFLRKVKRHAANQHLSFRWVPSLGKGSHGTLYVGDKGRTTVPDLKKELPGGTFRGMCAQLFIDPKDL